MDYLLIEKDKNVRRSCSAIFLWTNNTKWDVMGLTVKVETF
jgi:hypothetical protein